MCQNKSAYKVRAYSDNKRSHYGDEKVKAWNENPNNLFV